LAITALAEQFGLPFVFSTAPDIGPLVRPLAFNDLIRLPVIAFYEAAFAKATGVPLKVVPPGEPDRRLCFGLQENAFCALVTGTPTGCAACREAQGRLQRAVARSLNPQQISCFAGLTDVAVPVLVGGRQIATLMSGQVFRREPTERDFRLITAMIIDRPDGDWERRARAAYFATPVVTADRFQAIIQLLNVFAQYLADFAGRQIMANAQVEPAAVTRAKQFVQDHVDESINLGQVVEQVGVSRFYFCKLFKKATGMTLTEYVTRVRIEKAKTLLVDPSLRISEIVFAAGFGSIPRFNSVFKQHVGMPPTEYRLTLRAPLRV
jgi:AraC-like DNA-binding protein/ligand-binding sensor protein